MPNIVFDLGGVLIDWNPRHLYRKLLPSDDAVEEFLANICTPEWNGKQDEGRSFDDAIEELVERFPERSGLIRAFRDRWPEMLNGAMDDTVTLLDQLRKAHPVYALTNWSAETYPYALSRFDFLSWFKGVVVSGTERVKKPDERIFQILIERYGLTPSETIFIDDSSANVAVAASLGIDAIHYVGAHQLRNELGDRGLVASPTGRPTG